MPVIKKTKKVAQKTTKKTKKPTRLKTKIPKKSASLTLVKTKPKNTLAYYECLCHQTQQGLKGKRITRACQECKYNALVINTKMSAQKLKDVQELAQAHANFKQILEKYVSKH